MLHNYFAILVFVLFAAVLACIIPILSKITSYLTKVHKPDKEKNSPYECGFNPFEDSRDEFDIRFYIVAILFLVFDLEISFLFPFSVSLDCSESIPFYSMLLFLVILTIGFVYE